MGMNPFYIINTFSTLNRKSVIYWSKSYLMEWIASNAATWLKMCCNVEMGWRCFCTCRRMRDVWSDITRLSMIDSNMIQTILSSNKNFKSYLWAWQSWEIGPTHSMNNNFNSIIRQLSLRSSSKSASKNHSGHGKYKCSTFFCLNLFTVTKIFINFSKNISIPKFLIRNYRKWWSFRIICSSSANKCSKSTVGRQ